MTKSVVADPLDQLVETILASSKYQNISPDFVHTIGEQELAKRRNWKEAVKATKNKLHQVGGAYLKPGLDYTAWLAELRAAAHDRDDFRRVCRSLMGYHASTAERLPILEQFYATTLAGLPPFQTILDIACGLNPLALPWLPLRPDTAYYAYDIYQDQVDFLNQFFSLAQVNGQAEARDVIHDCPTQPADLALLLKAIPCLEQVDKNAGAHLLETINARYLLVSFPIHSLGGRSKGMAVNYEARFRALVGRLGWPVRRFEFATELAFLITK
jgi:16S rRNA (guanine(1405)-N(7))-methyltransferase